MALSPSSKACLLEKTGGEVFLHLQKRSREAFDDEKKDFKVIRGKEATMTSSQQVETKESSLTNILMHYLKIFTQKKDKHLGYPLNMDCEVYVKLAPLLGFHINNYGDPFTNTIYGVHSKPFEVDVLNWFAELWEIEKHEYWGYITNGGTEGNLHGILLGRELLPDGILYTSKESHYSIFKAARMYRMKYETVETMANGEIDCKDLEQKLLLNKDKPAIINLNIGTTFKGGIDDLDSVIKILEECGFSHDQFYIHCDAALFGLIIPFVKSALKITFKKPIGSVTISGHKFLGCPMPCGVQMTRKKHIGVISRSIEYIASVDATISGSRNGHTPIFMWYGLNKKGHEGLEDVVKKCLENAQYLKAQLQKKGLWAMCNQFSTIVVFDRPMDNDFVLRWQLACQENMAHVVVMPNTTTRVLDDFVDELVERSHELNCCKN